MSAIKLRTLFVWIQTNNIICQSSNWDLYVSAFKLRMLFVWIQIENNIFQILFSVRIQTKNVLTLNSDKYCSPFECRQKQFEKCICQHSNWEYYLSEFRLRIVFVWILNEKSIYQNSYIEWYLFEFKFRTVFM